MYTATGIFTAHPSVLQKFDFVRRCMVENLTVYGCLKTITLEFFTESYSREFDYLRRCVQQKFDCARMRAQKWCRVDTQTWKDFSYKLQ